MTTMAKNFASYDWATWVVGIMRSFISGGAGAVSGAIGPMVTDPKDWNLGTGFNHVLESMLIGFLIAGFVHLAIFLQTHAVPEPIKGEDK